MSTRLTAVVIASADPAALARWWAAALGWQLGYESDDESDVVPPDGEAGLELTFVPVHEPKLVKNRLHLDLRSGSLAEQQALTERLLAAGASPADVGQGPAGSVPWTVLADPEGNEFCVLDPRPEYAETGALAAVVIDSLDPAAMAAFWTVAAGMQVRENAAGDFDLVAGDDRGPWLEFVVTKHLHEVQNRLHLDVAGFVGDEQAAQVEQLIALGARRVDIGQSGLPAGQLTWVVLADPEGNEFCVLSSR